MEFLGFLEFLVISNTLDSGVNWKKLLVWETKGGDIFYQKIFSSEEKTQILRWQEVYIIAQR